MVWLVVAFYYRGGEWLDFALLPRQLDLYRLAVAPFIHVHPYHLGFNLALLWLFGSGLERAIGTVRFLLLYLTSAWFAGLMYWAVTVVAQTGWDVTAAGAAAGAVGSSGAIAGVLGAYVVRLPHRPLSVPFTPWLIRPAPLLAFWVGWEFVRALLATAHGGGAGVGSWAHFGGFVFGMGAAYLMRLSSFARREELANEASEAAARGEHARAAAAWKALARLAPDQVKPRLEMVRAYLAAGERPAAEFAGQQALAWAVRRGESGAALAWYAAFRELLPETRLAAGVRYRIGCWLAEAGRDQEAMVALMEAAHEDEATPAAAAALFRAGEIAADRLHDPRRARLAWQRILLDYSDTAWRDRAYARLGELGGGRK